MKHPSHLPQLARQLRGEGKKLREIAEILAVPWPTVAVWTRGVLPLRQHAIAPEKQQAMAELVRLYEQGMPIPEIAKALGIPASTLFDWRRELDLPKNKRDTYVTPDLRERISHKLSRDPDGTRKEEVAHLYRDEQLSVVDIAARLNISTTTVAQWLKQSGVSMRTVVTLRTRQKLAVASSGDKRWNWKGGISGENARARGSFEMRLAREACFQRDDYTCRCCQQRGGKLNAHHVWPFQRFPDWKYEVWNLVTLCKQCHDAFHKRAGGPVKVAIGPFFSTPGGVKEMPAPYEYRIAA